MMMKLNVRNNDGVESPVVGPTSFMPVQVPTQWLGNISNIRI